MKKLKIHSKINLIDVSFVIGIFLFFLSEYVTGIGFIDNFMIKMEKYKIKYIYLLACCILYMINMGISRKSKFKSELVKISGAIGVMAVISIGLQIFNGFKGDTLNEVMYFVTPLFFSFVLINRKNGRVEHVIDIIFYCLILMFFIIYGRSISLKSIISINFIKSYSPYESGFAFYSIILYIYYKYKGEKKKSIIALVICYLSFKRITFIFLIIFMFFYKKIKNTKVDYRVLVVIFSVLPLIMGLVFNDNFATFFQGKTGLNLNVFLKGRFEFINLLIDSNDIRYGLGSCRRFLSSYYQTVYGKLGYSNIAQYYDPHCDVLRFYLECGILGTVALNYAFFSEAKKSNISLFICTYIFIEACFNHVFGAGNTVYWILVYMVIYYFNYEYKNTDQDKELLKKKVGKVS